MSHLFECKYFDKHLYIKSEELNLMFCITSKGTLRRSNNKKVKTNKKTWIPITVSFEKKEITPEKKSKKDNMMLVDLLKSIKFDDFKKCLINALSKDLTKFDIVFNLSSFITNLKSSSKHENNYFRGYSSFDYELKPSIFFCYNREYNIDIIKEIESTFIKDFLFRFNDELAQKTLIEKISIMRHFNAPLRIVDVTSNPLVALYFACIESEKYNFGRVDIIDISKDKSIRSTDERFDEWKNIDSNIGELIPPVHVKVATKNQRIISQKGSFILCDKSFNPLSDDIRVIKKLLIVDKHNILNDLDKIGINQASLFPDMEHFVEYEKNTITNDYKYLKKETENYES